MPFVHLHTHSEYSLLDGANRIPELVAHVKKLGMDSLAVTDHGNMHAAWTFYEQAKAAEDPADSRLRGLSRLRAPQAREKPQWAPAAYSHLVLLARNRAGYKNLVRLTSIGFMEGFYRRPRIDKEVLAAHSEGLVGLAACLSGEIALSLRQGKYEEARQARSGSPDLRPRRLLAGDPASRHRRGAAGHRRDAPAGPGARHRGGGHQRRPLPPPGGRRGARRAAGHRDGERSGRSQAIPLSRPGVLRQVRSGDAGALSRSSSRRWPTPREWPSSASSTSRSATSFPSFPGPPNTRPTRSCWIIWPAPAPSGATDRPCRRRSRPAGLRARRHRQGGVRRLLPHRPGLHRRRPGAGHPGRTGPRLRRRLARGLRARDHQRLPAQVRPPVRAVPQPRAGVDARHRRGLLLRAPGRSDRVRPRALRTRRASGRSSPSGR